MTSLQCRTAGRSVVYRVPGGLPKHARMTRSSVACAARREGRDSDGEAKGRSWKEIGKEAAGLAREVARKATDSVRGLVARRADGPAPSGRRVDRVEAQWERPSSPDAKSLAPLFGGGLLGRAIGGLVGTAIQGVAGALQEAQAEARGALEEASDAIQADRRVQEALGTPVQVSGPLSQSMSKSSVNGVTSSQLNMVVAVSGPRGSAQASIASSEGRGIPRTTSAVVMLPGGRSINVPVGGGRGGKGGGRGDTIDAEIIR